MQEHRLNQTTTNRRRSVNREERSPNVMFTALTVGVVVLLLAVTFAADWLRTPELSITSAGHVLSPNQDNSYDTATINYRLSEEAQVSARVYSQAGGIVRVLIDNQKETSGQHFLVWNGADDLGARVADGAYRVEITAQGSVRSTATNAMLTVDTTPPALDLLNLPDGQRVRDDQLIIEGITDVGATVWLDNESQLLQVDSQGRFRTQKRLSDGVNKIQIRAVDEAGNTTALTRSIDLVTAPPPVVINSPADNAWINTSKITVEGQAPEGVTVKVNNQTVPIAADGAFRYDLLLDEGDQRIIVTATDDVGNVTTVERAVHIKTRGPRLEINVAEGATFSDPQLQLTGATSPGAVLSINHQTVEVGALGDFQTTINLLQGDNTISVEAHDQAGNGTVINRRVRYEIPTQPTGIDRLVRNVGVLPSVTIPTVLLLSILLGLFLYRQNQLSIELSVDTQSFTPGLPQEGKNLTLRLDLNQAARVTLEVLDQVGQAQAVLLDNRRRTARQHIFLWDGYDDYGRPVVPGTYTIRATAGSPPIKVSSAVQVQVDEDPYVYRQSGDGQKTQVSSAPGTLQPQVVARRRMRQNRKRI